MATFVNRTALDLDFTLDGVRYQVARGDVCEIPDRIAYVVDLQKLPLTPSAQADAEAEAPAAPPAAKRSKG